jgi:DNA-binding response OmpR family regulator
MVTNIESIGKSETMTLGEKSALIIDDNSDIIALLVKIVALKGFQVYTAIEAQKGLELFKTHEPEVVFLDVMMPKMDGLSLCRKIRSEIKTSRKPVIILMSAVYRSPQFRRDALQAGADEVIVKPFDINTVLSMIKKFFG